VDIPSLVALTGYVVDANTLEMDHISLRHLSADVRVNRIA
jgi:hypothetical protein